MAPIHPSDYKKHMDERITTRLLLDDIETLWDILNEYSNAILLRNYNPLTHPIPAYIDLEDIIKDRIETILCEVKDATNDEMGDVLFKYVKSKKIDELRNAAEHENLFYFHVYATRGLSRIYKNNNIEIPPKMIELLKTV